MRWIQRESDLAVVKTLQRDGGFSPLVARLLANRGITTPDQAGRYLNPSPADLFDPLLLPDIRAAADRLQRAVERRERVMLFGDYDVDGISAVSIYRELCAQLGLESVVRLPHRLSEGYGFSREAVREAKAGGVGLIITADCGTTALAEIAFARDEGVDVIVTDHHQVPHELPAAVATINPWRADSVYPFRGLCSAGLAWKVASAVAVQSWAPPLQAWLESCLDLVALGTIADVMPLQMENRYFVAMGLRRLSQGVRPGVRALKRVAGIEGKPVGVGTVNFALAPRLNAAGRLGDAGSGVELLTTKDDVQAARLAEHHQRENEARRAIEEIVLRDALAQTASIDLGGTTAVVAAGTGWHPGVIGIVAARLVEKYYRPAIVIAVDPSTGIGRGSGRTISGIDLYAALEACATHLVQFGGHRMAAGLTIRGDQIDAFRAAFAEATARQVKQETLTPALTVDAVVGLDECSWSLVESIGRLAPFGPGNPEPVFTVRDVAPFYVKTVGKGHLRMTLRSIEEAGAPRRPTVAVPAVAFGQGHRSKELTVTGLTLDVACLLREDSWQSAKGGERRLQCQIKDFTVTPSPAARPLSALSPRPPGASPEGPPA